MIRLTAILGMTAPLLLLGSCMHGQQALSSGMAWSLQQTPEEGAKLAYGAPASDNVVLMMTCQPGGGEVLVSTVSATPAPTIVLTSGRERSALAATDAPSGMGEGHYLEASTHSADKALARFARTGDLTLVQNSRSVRLAANTADRPQVAGFFKACAA
ncbi:MAG: hypothetical protein GC145_11840 [Caulobacter sp.]|nr:hypothetical protein [Caulobacter sp.]